MNPDDYTLPSLAVAENRRGLVCGGKPFFWLGDTAWLLFQKCSAVEAANYLYNRKLKGFNVIQATLVHTLEETPTVRTDVRSPEYWDHVEGIVQAAGQIGLYMALLPCWGCFASDGSLNMDNVEQYADFLAERFGKYSHVIWLLGGDVRGSAAFDVFCRFGTLLKEKTKNQLVGFHPFGRTSSSYWFAEEKWLDFYMFQSGHRRYDQRNLSQWDDAAKAEEWYGEDNWRYVEHDLALPQKKPTIDGEPSYEQILQGLHDETQPRWQAKDVRRYAWWSVLQGAFGFTYGDCEIMQFFNADGRDKPSCGALTDWREAVHHEASGQMQHMKKLLESVDYQHGIADDGLLAWGQKEKYHRISVFRGDGFVICYDFSGDAFALNLKKLIEKDRTGRLLKGGATAVWLDPVSGAYSFIGRFDAADEVVFQPAKKYDGSSDWVLYLTW